VVRANWSQPESRGSSWCIRAGATISPWPRTRTGPPRASATQKRGRRNPRGRQAHMRPGRSGSAEARRRENRGRLGHWADRKVRIRRVKDHAERQTRERADTKPFPAIRAGTASPPRGSERSLGHGQDAHATSDNDNSERCPESARAILPDCVARAGNVLALCPMTSSLSGAPRHEPFISRRHGVCAKFNPARGAHRHHPRHRLLALRRSTWCSRLVSPVERIDSRCRDLARAVSARCRRSGCADAHPSSREQTSPRTAGLGGRIDCLRHRL